MEENFQKEKEAQIVEIINAHYDKKGKTEVKSDQVADKTKEIKSNVDKMQSIVQVDSKQMEKMKADAEKQKKEAEKKQAEQKQK